MKDFYLINQIKLNKIIVFLLVIFIIFGPIYKYTFEGFAIDLRILRNLFYFLILVLLILGIYTQKFHKHLLISYTFILASLIVNGLGGISKVQDLIKPTIQAFFSFCLIQYSINNSKLILEELRRYKNLVIIIGLIFFTGNYFALTNNQVLINYLHGFGGNRVNFSISCIQIIGLSILISLGTIKNIKEEILLFITIFGIILTQVISGGRAGLLVSILIYIGFIFILSKRNKLIKILILIFAIYIFRELALQSGIPQNNKYAYTDVARIHPDVIVEVDNLIHSNSNKLHSLYIIFDELSSYRLSILKHTIQELSDNIYNLTFGNGSNNFYVRVGNEIYEPHVVFLNQIGQYGIFYTIGVLYFLVILFRKIKLNSFLDYYCLAFLSLSFLQPALIHTQISTSIIFFILSGIIIKRYNNY